MMENDHEKVRNDFNSRFDDRLGRSFCPDADGTVDDTIDTCHTAGRNDAVDNPASRFDDAIDWFGNCNGCSDRCQVQGR